MQMLLQFWRHPLSLKVDINSEDMVSVHQKLIQEKPYLKFIYKRWYQSFIEIHQKVRALQKPFLELGSGAGHLEKYIPEIIKSDVFQHPNVHQTIDSSNLPFANESLASIFILNAFHHFPEPMIFLTEAYRCLAKGGYLVLVEPSNSPLQKFMIQKFHPCEYYDDQIEEWRNSTEGRLGSCNNALPYVVFERDQKKLKSQFPLFKIQSIKKHTFLSYFISGGFSYRGFLPNFFLPFVVVAEYLLEKLVPNLGTEMTITIEKV